MSPTSSAARGSPSPADGHTVLRLPGASSAGAKAAVSIRRTVGAAEADGRWWQHAGLATGRAAWVASLALIVAGLLTLWQLLFAGSAGGDVWLGREWEPPIQHRSEGSTSVPAETDSDDCAVPPAETVEPEEDSGGNDSGGEDNSGSGSDDSCSEDGSGDDNSGSGSGGSDGSSGDDNSGGSDDSTSSPEPTTEDSESDDNSGPGSGGSDDSGGDDNSGPGSGGSDETDPGSGSDDGDY